MWAGASLPNILFVYSSWLSLVLSLCGLYPNRGYLRLRPGPRPPGYSCSVTWSADASKSCMLTAINLSRHVNAHTHTHSHSMSDRSTQITTLTHTQTHTQTHTHIYWMNAQWPGQKEKIKIMCSIACIQPSAWKIPIEQLERGAKTG